MKYSVGDKIHFAYDGVKGYGAIVNSRLSEADVFYSVHVLNGTFTKNGKDCIGKLHTCSGRAPKGHGWNIRETGVLSVESQLAVLDKILNRG